MQWRVAFESRLPSEQKKKHDPTGKSKIRGLCCSNSLDSPLNNNVGSNCQEFGNVRRLGSRRRRFGQDCSLERAAD